MASCVADVAGKRSSLTLKDGVADGLVDVKGLGMGKYGVIVSCTGQGPQGGCYGMRRPAGYPMNQGIDGNEPFTVTIDLIVTSNREGKR
jgi:hypothetical protein